MEAVLVVAGTVVLVAAALLLLVPVCFLLIQLAASRRRSDPTTPAGLLASTVALIIPAHNEAEGIIRTLGSATSDRDIRVRLVVVADNCDDDTAAVAQRHSAEVVTRTDPDRRGKGYALAAGMDYLKASTDAAPDVVVMIDADCLLRPNALKELVAQCLTTGHPAQGLFVATVENGASLGERLSAFAWRVRNEARPIGLTRLGLACHIMGSGMAFPWSIAATMDLAGGALAEDLLLGADLAVKAYAPRLCEAAVIETSLARTRDGRTKQKTRWVQGHLGVLRSRFGPLLHRALRHRDLIAFFIALDLAVPPLALLVTSTTLLLGLSLIWWVVTGNLLPACAAALPWVATAFSVVLAWSRFGRDLVSPAELVTEGPKHLLSTIGAVGALMVGRRVRWERTTRTK